MEKKSIACSGLSGEASTLTETQQRYLLLLRTHGTIGKSAKAAGVHYSSVTESLASAAKRLGFDCLKSLVKEYGTVEERQPKVKTEKKHKGHSLVRQIVSIVEKQDFRCALSGVPLLPETSNLDHKHPVSRGGSDHIDNLQWLDGDVNRAKGAMLNEDFILMCKRVAAWNR